MRYILVAFAALPFLIAAGFIVRGLRVRGAETDLRRTGTATTGTVVENQNESRTDGTTIYRPVVEFTTATGRRVKAVGDTPARRSWVTGSVIAVVYDPQRPTRITTGPGASQRYLVAGGLFLVFGVLASLVVRWILGVVGTAA